jgi:ComF family protein
LSATEEVLCNKCNFHLPRTGFSNNPYENEMAKLFWGQIPVERAAALFHYESHAETANIIYQLKYKDHPEIGPLMGRMMAAELQKEEFFDGIDVIVPVPLTRERLRQRGYNQSEEIAKGVSEITGLPINKDVVKRTVFQGSQTRRSRWERQENVEYAFKLTHGEPIAGKHLLIVDDVVTTGATIIACAKELVKAGNVKISILSLGLTRH